MARAIWSGSISFGLVNVPVKLYPAVSRKTVKFHQLHDKDGVPIRQKRVCPAFEVIGPLDEIEAISFDCGCGLHVIGWPEPVAGA